MLATEGAMGRMVKPAWTVTAEQRAEVEALLRRTDLVPRVRERLGVGEGGDGGAGRRAARGAAGQGRCGLPADVGGDGRDGAAELRPAVRRVDLAPAERVPGRGDRGADRAGLAAGAAGAAGLRVRAAQAHPRAPAGPRRGRRLPGR